MLTHPWLLLFCFGAAIPLLVHYWSRLNHVRMPWAAQLYLQMAMKQVERRFTLFQWLLLLLRVGVVLLLATCLTLPMFNDDYQLLQQQKQLTTLKVIVLDTSFSMQAVEQNRSRLEEAKKTAYRLIDESDPADTFVVFTFADTLVDEITEPVTNRAIVLESIDSISGTQMSGNVRGVVNQLVERCNSKRFQAFDRVELHVISDFAAKDWLELNTNLDAELDELESLADLIRHPVTQGNLANNFVAGLALGNSVSIVGKTNKLRVDVQNRGSLANQDVVVDLLIDGNVVDSKTTRLSPDSRSLVPFEFVLDQAGSHELKAVINDDQLNLDNQRYAVVNVRSRYRVLLLEDRPGSSRFLKLALDPAESGRSDFEFRSLSPVNLNSMLLDQTDLILLDNVRSMTKAHVERCKRYMESGGNVVVFPGDLVDRNQFNQFWNGGPSSSLGLELVGTQPVADYRLDPLEYKSRFLQAFRGNPQAGLTSMPIWCYFKAVIQDGAGWETHLAFQNGDPFMISKRFGNGNFVLFTSSSSSESKTPLSSQPGGQEIPWNANETIPAFPALIQEVFSNLLQKGNLDSIRVGGVASDSFEERAQVIAQELTTPDGESMDLDVEQQNGLVTYRSRTMNRSGIYRLEFKTPKSTRVRWVAINLDPEEGDLRAMEFDDKESGIPSGETSSSILFAQLFQLALLALGILLLVETFAGYRIGQGRG